jgi:hypothetical protein
VPAATAVLPEQKGDADGGFDEYDSQDTSSGEEMYDLRDADSNLDPAEVLRDFLQGE